MAKRTSAQIEKDYKRIRVAAKTAKSIVDIQEMTNLSYSEIMVSLKKHPTVLKRIKKQLEEAHTSKTMPESKSKTDEQYIVIDTSITAFKDIENVLKNEDKKIMMTSVVVKELAQMQHFEDSDAMRARHLLLMAAENEDKFVHKLIDETLETADKCILDFCEKNKDSVLLYTSDKEMYNFAKIYSIPVKFFKAEMNEKKNSKITTFHGTKRVGRDLIIDLDSVNTDWRMVKVISEDKEITSGITALKVNDEIFLASQKDKYVVFAHYKVISLWADDNCSLIFSKRLNNLNKLDFNHRYKSFLRDFKRKIA